MNTSVSQKGGKETKKERHVLFFKVWIVKAKTWSKKKSPLKQFYNIFKHFNSIFSLIIYLPNFTRVFNSMLHCNIWASLVAQMVKRLPTMSETWVQSLGWEDPLEKEMATHSSTLAWKIPWMEEPGSLQSTGSQRVGHD